VTLALVEVGHLVGGDTARLICVQAKARVTWSRCSSCNLTLVNASVTRRGDRSVGLQEEG
jgi:hypothetical protein